MNSANFNMYIRHPLHISTLITLSFSLTRFYFLSSSLSLLLLKWWNGKRYYWTVPALSNVCVSAILEYADMSHLQRYTLFGSVRARETERVNDSNILVKVSRLKFYGITYVLASVCACVRSERDTGISPSIANIIFFFYYFAKFSHFRPLRRSVRTQPIHSLGIRE